MSNSELHPHTHGSSESQSSGTTAQIPEVSPDLERLLKTAHIAPLERPNQSRPNGEAQALETHEVIELQTFSERKAWIEEKIKFLEAMPPIEVFVGLEAVRTSAEEVPGLPAREELQQWVVEHDIIEKETEIFDKGELGKLRQLTKAATQRNLSPEDTDVIELTLTTIYALDKLLHLLRNRSENLDLLGIRLTWEENRIAAWVARRTLLQDLQNFLDTRARWSPSVYDNMPIQDDPSPLPTLKRRGSMTSLTSSIASDISSLSTAVLSRSSRFKMAEILSRDAAQYGARVTSLRQGKVAAAGKALDKLIDNSRKPVPDPLLDEQDHLEEKAIHELEHLGKFVMNIIMQWRKADEIYVETTKDLATAQNLMEEIEIAKLHHPTARQSASFISRADALIKRLALRGNPVSPTSTFPRPEHPLFPEQRRINESLAQQLAAEIASATDNVRKVDAMAKDYRATWDAVKRAETLNQSASELATTFDSLAKQLINGVPTNTDDGDGSPPDLNVDSCLESTRHSVFLALLPNILDSYTQADQAALALVNSSRSILTALTFEGVDDGFPPMVQASVDTLSAKWKQVKTTVDDVISRASRLREARKLWNGLQERQSKVEEIRDRLWEMTGARKRKESLRNSTTDQTYTPTSIGNDLIATIERQLHNVEGDFSRDVEEPLLALRPNLGDQLSNAFSKDVQCFRDLVSSSRRMMSLVESLDRQAVVVQSLRKEFTKLLDRINDTRSHIDAEAESTLSGRQLNSINGESHDITDIRAIEDEVKKFVGSLSGQVPFVSFDHPMPEVPEVITKRPRSDRELPFDLSSHDDAIRAECNNFALTLNGGLETLKQSKARFALTKKAKKADFDLASISLDIEDILGQLDGYQKRFTPLSDVETASLDDLIALSEDVEGTLQTHLTRLSASIAATRDTLTEMSGMPGIQDPPIYERLYLARCKATDEVETDFKAWLDECVSLSKRITATILDKQTRLEQLRVAEEQRLESERRRLAAEEAERSRLQQERLKAEQKRKVENARLELERRLEEERLQREAEEARRQKIERQRLEREELKRQEEQKAAELKRREAEAAEKARLEKERLEMEEKLRSMEEQLALERQVQSERERASAQETERLRLEAERISQLRAEEQKRAEEELRRAIEEERTRAKMEMEKQTARASEDAFDLRVSGSDQQAKPPHLAELQAQILALRMRLRTLSVDDIIRPSKPSQFPSEELLKRKLSELNEISTEVAQLPASIDDPSVDVELRSLRAEAETCVEWSARLTTLLSLSDSLKSCDSALSDLLEHIDSYPALPSGVLSSPYRDTKGRPAQEQLSARMDFTRGTINEMAKQFSAVSDDPRALSERHRVLQAWSELEEMCLDHLGGKKARPPSVVSSHPSSGKSGSMTSASMRTGASGKKPGAFSSLSAAPAARGRHIVGDAGAVARRAVSGEHTNSLANRPPARPPSQMSNRTSRATSGPHYPSLYSSTFASRQRTNSITPASANTTPANRRASTSSRGHDAVTHPTTMTTTTTRGRRTESISDASLLSRPASRASRSSTSMSTWSRAPRNSLTSLVGRGLTPKKPSAPVKPKLVARKKYIADPKSKLDMAVGDVVNQLPIEINISVEGVTGTWKDQSGKYWIGDQDPKLCFCRILRSHTVMVRVGGGWQELSRFIQDHFAESFRLVPDSPQQAGGEERWISPATLLEQAETESDTLPDPPRTPEPDTTFIPSFALSTPTSQNSPQSIKSPPTTPKGGSPLTAIQFMRRADPELLRPGTPTKAPAARSRSPAPNSFWRP